MSLEQKLSQVSPVVERLAKDSKFCYGESWQPLDVDYLECSHLLEQAYFETDISNKDLPRPDWYMSAEELIDYFPYSSFEEMPVGHYLCTRQAMPSASVDKAKAFGHWSLKYSDTEIASLGRPYKPIKIMPAAQLLGQSVLLTKKIVETLIKDEVGIYRFDPKVVERQKLDLEARIQRLVCRTALINFPSP